MKQTLFISTAELFNLLLKNKIVEASLNDGILNATHFIRFGGRKIFDMGIDSKEISWKKFEFLRYYENTYWKIDQIIN